ncbi:MAG: ATP-binding protein [Halarcobacter ebronensis]|uniref:ATP-binding protein n=1 Tax=Halarcobacter ebronensis TaxID=1462615 RepID=UPI003C73EEB0
MIEEQNPWKKRFERERNARKESEALLEEKSIELWQINQDLEKEVEKRTKDLEIALIEANKAHKAKSDFLANMSHEIRTPLNAIIGFAQYLSKSEKLDTKDSKYASIIETSAVSLLSIINDILDFSKIENGNFEIFKNKCEAYSLCKNIVELFSQKMGEKYIDFNFNFDEDIPKSIVTDEVRLKQVISNLLSNAIKFTQEEGSIVFNVKLIEKNDNLALLLFEIIDTGLGIPKEKISSILDPFIQLENITNKQHVGTGLGLSICNNILKLLDSKIEIESEENKGSKFSFYLECNISSELEEEIEEYEEEENYNINVLLAEDNSANQELMKLVFKELELNLTIATNGFEVIEKYIHNPNLYDIVLMDINMPEINGIEAYKEIRSFEKKKGLDNIPIVALTANAIKGDKERFIDLGMNDYLSKPIKLPELKNLLSKYSKK